MMQLSGSIRYEFSQSRRLLFTSSTRSVYEIVDPKQTPTAGVAITSRIKKLNFPPFIKVKVHHLTIVGHLVEFYFRIFSVENIISQC